MSSQVACFGYHDVTDDPTESGFQRNGALPFKLGTRLFEHHLDRIAAGPSAPELVTGIDLALPGQHLLLTFDDGGKSALPIGDELCRRGWRAHFFIATSLIGRRTFLAPDEIRQLRSRGHLVGSHSHTHPSIYRELDRGRMLVEWRQSCDIIAQLLGEPCLTAAVPGGEISRAVLRSADLAGIRHLFTSEPWLTPRIVGGCWVLGRFCPKAFTSAAEIGELARFRGWSTKLLGRRLKTLARRSMPQLYRLYVSRSTREWQEQSR
ncbi:MAG: polysaccharide deacetylase family protein [Gemmatimonadales bacterium]